MHLCILSVFKCVGGNQLEVDQLEVDGCICVFWWYLKKWKHINYFTKQGYKIDYLHKTRQTLQYIVHVCISPTIHTAGLMHFGSDICVQCNQVFFSMMEFDFGLPTIMKRGRPARNDFHEYINSPEILRNEVFKQWRQMTLSCGHTNLGVFYECAWCKDTKCARCWNTCKRKSVAQSLLSLSVQVAVVDARDLAATEFENKAGDFLSCPPNRPPPPPQGPSPMNYQLILWICKILHHFSNAHPLRPCK